ncbi:MAG: hypothetical protein HYY16_01805 [Planctomycetes bacterium]|nr:hypothetical protein [Planctomycetota bacterium]
MEAIDTVYEYAGYQAAMALHQTLAGLAVPLIIALAGLAWRFMRVAEDGLARPLAIYVLSLILTWWLLSPVDVVADGRAKVRAPRFVVALTSAGDVFSRRATRALNEGFLRRPFEWERIAAMCGLARVFTADTKENLRAFFKVCTRPAIAGLSEPPHPYVEENPLGIEAELPYHRYTFTWRAGSRRGQHVGCETARAELLAAVDAEVRGSPYHREVMNAMAQYEGRGTEERFRKFYVNQVIRNEWNHPASDEGEMAGVRAAVGRYEFLDPARTTVRDPETLTQALALNTGAAFYSAVLQAGSDSVNPKQKYYLITTLGPELYGLFLLLLIALFPIAGLWALLPGKWTALVHFSKVFLSVKLWPVGWAILSALTDRRPALEAIVGPGQPIAHTGNLFIGIAMMYFIVPALSFAAVNIATAAASMPFREAMAPTAGGNPVRDLARVGAGGSSLS